MWLWRLGWIASLACLGPAWHALLLGDHGGNGGEDLAGGGRGIGWLSGAMVKNGYTTDGIVKQLRVESCIRCMIVGTS